VPNKGNPGGMIRRLRNGLERGRKEWRTSYKSKRALMTKPTNDIGCKKERSVQENGREILFERKTHSGNKGKALRKEAKGLRVLGFRGVEM